MVSLDLWVGRIDLNFLESMLSIIILLRLAFFPNSLFKCSCSKFLTFGAYNISAKLVAWVVNFQL